ncbi:MAG: hypothetical protein Q7S44_01535 [bacterium]|nr:hypothetical protein [bacterium]
MKSKSKEKGQVLVLALVVVGLVMVNTILIAGGSLIFFQNSTYSVQSSQALNIAEAGVDKALASLNANPEGYNGESETPLGPGSFSVEITTKDASTDIIKATGYIPNKTSPKVKRTVSVEVSQGVGISFVYGILVGEGGITMGNGSTINGSIYANNSILGGNNELITGDAIVAGGTQPDSDQQSDCTSCTDFAFGASIGGNDRLDVAQSFKPATTAVINKVSLKLKKVGSPANAPVMILADNNGAPNKNSILAIGTLSANMVTTQYPQNGLVDVVFTSSSTLTTGTTYWLVVAPQNLDNSDYWILAEDTSFGYIDGSPAWSANWQAKNPSWSAVAGDFAFQTWMGGVATSISMNNGSVVRGDVRAHTIGGITVNKDAYYQLISDSTVLGTSHQGYPDPQPMPMPISQSNIDKWRSDAEIYGLISSTDITGCPATLGPGKIDANIITDNNCLITVTTPIWITGNLTFGNSTIFQMDPSLGSSSGVIIVDGTTTFQNSDNLLGTGQSGSYLTLLSVYDSRSSGTVAINTGNSSITGILYAPFGIISLSNNANFKEAVAWGINMGTGTILTYDSGLVSTFFSAGPGGSFSVVKGTYQLK